LVAEEGVMGRKSQWSKFRWRPGLPDDPALWKLDGGKVVPNYVDLDIPVFAAAFPLVRWTVPKAAQTSPAPTDSGR
jgi:hypothetical protein